MTDKQKETYEKIKKVYGSAIEGVREEEGNVYLEYNVPFFKTKVKIDSNGCRWIEN